MYLYPSASNFFTKDIIPNFLTPSIIIESIISETYALKSDTCIVIFYRLTWKRTWPLEESASYDITDYHACLIELPLQDDTTDYSNSNSTADTTWCRVKHHDQIMKILEIQCTVKNCGIIMYVIWGFKIVKNHSNILFSFFTTKLLCNEIHKFRCKIRVVE